MRAGGPLRAGSKLSFIPLDPNEPVLEVPGGGQHGCLLHGQAMLSWVQAMLSWVQGGSTLSSVLRWAGPPF